MNDSDDPFRRLAFRLFEEWYVGRVSRISGEQIPGKIEVLPGALPDDLPPPISLPPDSDLIGSIVTAVRRMTVVFDTARSIEDLRKFYRREMTQAGWKGPFGSEEYPVAPVASHWNNDIYCQSETGPQLRVLARTGDRGQTCVRLVVHVLPESAEVLCRDFLGPNWPPWTT